MGAVASELKVSDWIERADWRHRSAGFGGLREHRDRGGEALVAMQFAPPGQSAPSADRLWQLWAALPLHPNVLEAVAPDDRLLRYAALDWKRQGDVTEDPVARVAMWGVELTRVYEFLAASGPKQALGWMACPIVEIDLEGEVRVAFVAAKGSPTWMERLPPEVPDRWPRCDDRALVFVVGQLVRDLLGDDGRSTPQLDQIVHRCLAPDPASRFPTLADLREALVAGWGQRKPCRYPRPPRRVWGCLESGIGYLALGRPAKMLEQFEAAVEQDRLERTTRLGRRAPNAQSFHARACREEAVRTVAAADTPTMVWTDAEPAGLQLEHERKHLDALAIYSAVRLEGADLVALETAAARCHLRLADFSAAGEHAGRALRLAPGHREALAIRVDVLLRMKQYTEALQAADAWLAAAPDDGRPHHARGKSLLALGRLPEARAAFDRASTLGPELLEAMLLRREVDRFLDAVRASAGTAIRTTIELPAHLAELRDVLVGGQIDDGIQVLRRPEYGTDAVAQLLLAGLLSFDCRDEEAAQIYDVVMRLDGDRVHAALLGKASSLLELGRAAEALALFDRVCAERPELVEAIEGRARALQVLGRSAEAEEALQRYISITGRRSDLRVRASRLGRREGPSS